MLFSLIPTRVCKQNELRIPVLPTLVPCSVLLTLSVVLFCCCAYIPGLFVILECSMKEFRWSCLLCSWYSVEAGSITRSKLRKKSNRALWWNDVDIALGQRAEDGMPGYYITVIRNKMKKSEGWKIGSAWNHIMKIIQEQGQWPRQKV